MSALGKFGTVPYENRQSCQRIRHTVTNVELGAAIVAVWALYENTFKDACVMDQTPDEATLVLSARPQVISLGKKRRRG